MKTTKANLTVLFVALGGLALAAIGGPVAAGGPDRDRPSPLACTGLDVISPQQDTAQRRPGAEPRFSATQIIDIEFELGINRAPAQEHLAHFRVYTPRGHLYEQIDVPFAPSGHGRSQTRLAGYPNPVDIAEVRETARDNESQFKVPALLPVAGTMIMTGSLYGQWTVEAALEEHGEPCRQQVFYILDTAQEGQ